jgi:hypothetical protein
VLKKSFPTEGEIPVEIRAFYTRADDGSFALHGEIAKDFSELESEISAIRKSNIEVRQAIDRDRVEVEKMKAELQRFSDIDIAKLSENQELARRFGESALIAHGGGEIVQRRYKQAADEHLANVRAEAEKEIAEKENRLSELNEQIADILIGEAVAQEARLQGVKPSAIPDVVARARWPRPGAAGVALVDGRAVVVQDGAPVFSAKTTAEMTIREFVASLNKSASHLFQESRGGGASSASGASIGDLTNGTVNPYDAGPKFNLTRQAALERDNPTLASLLRSQARG